MCGCMLDRSQLTSLSHTHRPLHPLLSYLTEKAEKGIPTESIEIIVLSYRIVNTHNAILCNDVMLCRKRVGNNRGEEDKHGHVILNDVRLSRAY